VCILAADCPIRQSVCFVPALVLCKPERQECKDNVKRSGDQGQPAFLNPIKSNSGRSFLLYHVRPFVRQVLSLRTMGPIWTKLCIVDILLLILLLLAFTTHLRVLASSVLRFRDHTQWHNTVGRTPLDDWSARRRDLYLTNTQHSQQTNIHVPGGIRTRNPSRRAAADPRLRPLGHWDRLLISLLDFNYFIRRPRSLVYERRSRSHCCIIYGRYRVYISLRRPAALR
jgi:hypothetical protein